MTFDKLMRRVTKRGAYGGYVPSSIRRSRVATWLWKRTRFGGWFSYERARRLARWLP